MLIDDLLITASNEKLIGEFKEYVKKKFELTYSGLLT